MSPEELQLECVKLAMEQVRREGLYGDRKHIAETQTWFYNLITGCGAKTTDAQPEKVDGRRKPKAADKSVFD